MSGTADICRPIPETKMKRVRRRNCDTGTFRRDCDTETFRGKSAAATFPATCPDDFLEPHHHV
jgi:hypothetical protein